MNALTNIYLCIHAIEQRMEQDKINKDKDKHKVIRNKPANHNNNDYNNTQHDRQLQDFVCFIFKYKWYV